MGGRDKPGHDDQGGFGSARVERPPSHLSTTTQATELPTMLVPLRPMSSR